MSVDKFYLHFNAANAITSVGNGNIFFKKEKA